MREAFEKWVTDDGQWPSAAERNGKGYVLMMAESSWRAWQAAYAAGMGRATVICHDRACKEGTLGRISALQDCADAIRAEIGKEG